MQMSPPQQLHAVLTVTEVARTGCPGFVIGDPLLRREMSDAFLASGGEIQGEVEWNSSDNDWVFPVTPCVFVLDTRGAAEERLVEVLPRIGGAAGAADASIVVTVERAMINTVAGALMGARTQILCEADAAEEAVAFLVAADMIGHPVPHDSRVHENEAARLQRLNEEVARIAEVLSRLSRREAVERRGGAAEVFNKRLTFAHRPTDEIAIESGEIRRAIKGRRLRDQFFGVGLFEEPGWDMILDLFAAELEQSRVSVSSLCIAAAVAPTTALRWISKLTEAGLFERQPDPFDRRRAYMELSERASRAMRDYIGAMRRAGLSLA